MKGTTTGRGALCAALGMGVSAVFLCSCAIHQPVRISGLTYPPPRELTVTGAEKRIDLRWRLAFRKDLYGYNIYYRTSPFGRMEKLTDEFHNRHLYSDFVEENGVSREYCVTALYRTEEGLVESPPSAIRGGRSSAMTDEELLTSVQEAAFRYFWDYAHPVSGMARERSGDTRNDLVTTGATGFGLFNIMVGVERGFINRKDAARRVDKILWFLEKKADRFHGVWPHWLSGTTGETVPFSKFDNGGDLVETAFLVQGILAARQYFDSDVDKLEIALREKANRLWESVEWSWYKRREGKKELLWHWSPDYGWKMNHGISGFNECMIVYILAAASPTFPVEPEYYYSGWAGNPHYENGKAFYGITQPVGSDMGGPLFFTHYSYLGFDPRVGSDRFCNYFENNQAITRIHRAYCIDNPKKHTNYGDNEWGLTSSINPWGYAGHAPGDPDRGTITPTASISAMPYTPELSMAALKHMYDAYGPRLWGEFGFRDAFHMGEGWFSQSYLGIDQGTMAPMIENHRTELCWNVFMTSPEILPALEAIGWEISPQWRSLDQYSRTP